MAAPALTAVAALLGLSAAGHGDDLTTTVRNSPAAADDAANVTGKPPIGGGAYIDGYDSAGNPTLGDAGCACSSYANLPGSWRAPGARAGRMRRP